MRLFGIITPTTKMSSVIEFDDTTQAWPTLNKIDLEVSYKKQHSEPRRKACVGLVVKFI